MARKAIVSIEHKSKLSSDDWRELSAMMQQLHAQERMWRESFEEKQKQTGMVCSGFIPDPWTTKKTKWMLKDDDIIAIARDPKTSKPIGFCAAESKPELGWATCDGVFVASKWRKHGIASKLVNAVLDEVKRKGLESLDLRVSTKNKAAQAFYSKLGFAATALEMERWT